MFKLVYTARNFMMKTRLSYSETRLPKKKKKIAEIIEYFLIFHVYITNQIYLEFPEDLTVQP